MRLYEVLSEGSAEALMHFFRERKLVDTISLGLDERIAIQDKSIFLHFLGD